MIRAPAYPGRRAGVIVLGGSYFLYTSPKSELAPQEDQSYVLPQATSTPNSTPGTSILGLILAPRDKRKLGSDSLQQRLQQALSGMAGQNMVVFQLQSLRGAVGLPIQFAIKTTESADQLNDVSLAMLAEEVIEIDRSKTAQLELAMTQIGSALSALLRGNYTNYFQHGHALLQGGPAGAAAAAAERRPVEE